MIRATRKLAYEIRGPRKEKAKKPEKKVYRALITLEDQVGIHHLQHRVGKGEEFQTTLQHPHQFRKSLIRIFRLKNLRWELLRKDREGKTTRMPVLMQILEEEAEYVLRIMERKRKRPNAPAPSKRKHFERANHKKEGKGDFSWSPPEDKNQKVRKPEPHVEPLPPPREKPISWEECAERQRERLSEEEKEALLVREREAEERKLRLEQEKEEERRKEEERQGNEELRKEREESLKAELTDPKKKLRENQCQEGERSEKAGGSKESSGSRQSGR
jgi:hypothetical protein